MKMRDVKLARGRSRGSTGRVGMTHVRVEVANPARPGRRVRLRMLVDSGAMHSIVDGETLRKLGIRPTGTRTFILADGTEIIRRVGTGLFRFRGEEAGSIVVFGEPGDAVLIGVVTLEEFGLMLDPVRRELHPIQMSL